MKYKGFSFTKFNNFRCNMIQTNSLSITIRKKDIFLSSIYNLHLKQIIIPRWLKI